MNDKWEILHGDALKLLGGFAPGAFDAVDIRVVYVYSCSIIL